MSMFVKIVMTAMVIFLPIWFVIFLISMALFDTSSLAHWLFVIASTIMIIIAVLFGFVLISEFIKVLWC